jgi:hypothetical protein
VPPSAYVGLTTVNNLNRFLVVLPDQLFRADGYVEVQIKKTIYMVWKDISALNKPE